jgi:SAM-dependent methyltransferase
MTPAARRWADELAAWAVPAHILDRAPRRPFVFSPEMFAAPSPGRTPSRSTAVAAEALVDGGCVLDVGCGGGAAAFALTPPATQVLGTDRQADMLELFATTAAERGVPHLTVLGSWPQDAFRVPMADVVVCHDVLYNAPDLQAFAAALHRHARRRVVLEVTEHHPQVARAPLWRHFWGLDRPTGPTAALAAEALREAGFRVQVEPSPQTPRREERTPSVEARFWCRQLCLPPEREDEVAALLRDLPFPSGRVTLWWDVQP